MAALSSSRNTPEKNFAGARTPAPFGVEASTSLYVGGMVALDANGYAVPAQAYGTSPLNVLQVMGVLTKVYAGGDMPPGVNAINLSTASGLFPPNLPSLGSAGAISVYARRGIFGMDNDSSISAANLGALAFAADDHTVSLTDGSGGTTVPNTTSITVPAAAPLVNVLHPYIQPGSFNAYSATGGGGTHYVENTDFAVDYQTGLFVVLAGGAISASGTVYITYKYGKATKPVAGQIFSIENGLVYIDFTTQSLPALNGAGLQN